MALPSRGFAPLALALLACAPPPSLALAPSPARAPTRAPAPAPSPDPAATLAARIDPLFAAFTASGALSPGCAVGVYRAGEILFAKGYGSADLEHDAPMTPSTPVYTASLSKQFTAAAVLLLAGEGKLALDDDVRRYLPELHDFGARVTVEQLLHHTSGIRDYHLLLQLEGVNEEDVLTRREILWLLSHQRTLGFPPGSRFSYSSSGYFLLSEIVARVSGESFGAFLARRFLGPLGMTASHVREDHARVIPRRAIGYTRGADGQLRSFMGNLEYDGSSNFVSTVEDLAKWDGSFYAPKVGGQALVDAMRVVGKLTDGTPLDYAMGLSESERHGLHVEEHDGSYAGYRTVLTRYPSERLTVAVLCNTTEADADGLGVKLAEVLLPQLTAPEPPSPADPAPVPLAASGVDLARIAGTFVDPELAEARVVDVTEGVVRLGYARSTRSPRELVPLGHAEFAVKGGHAHYTFEAAKGAQPARLVRTWKPETPQVFARLPTVDHVETLADYAGRFGSDELAHELELRVEDGKLVDGPVGGAANRDPLVPVARDLFASEDVGWRFERDARGKVVRLVASTDRARGVVLVKRQER